MKKRSAYNRGTSNPNAALTPRLVVEIRRMRSLGYSLGFLAAWLDVSKSCVQHVCDGSRWRTA